MKLKSPALLEASSHLLLSMGEVDAKMNWASVAFILTDAIRVHKMNGEDFMSAIAKGRAINVNI